MACKRYRAAFTLIELIVVVAIIATLLTIAVPTMSRMGILGRDPINSGARELLSAMKAARIYASTYHVDTAVVFNVEMLEDSLASGTYRPVIDGYALARRITEDEWKRLDAEGFVGGGDPEDLIMGSEEDTVRPFVPLRDDDGVFRLLPEGAGVMWTAFDYDGQRMMGGFTPVRLYNASGNGSTVTGIELVQPRKDQTGTAVIEYPYAFTGTSPNFDFQRYRFPAYVFKPTGIVTQFGNDTRARLAVQVGPTPNAPKRARFIDEAATQPVDSAEIWLYTTTGRAQIESYEDDNT